MTEKLLSILIVGRNDDYLGNYNYRLQTCLDFLAKNLRTLGRLDQVEVVFVDWSSKDETLADVIEVGEDAASILRFVIVPPDVARVRNPNVSFFTTCAVNVGVRRAKGQFIMLADSDSMMPLPSLDALLKVLDGTLPTYAPKEELIYPIPRHQIPGALAARRPNVRAWEEILKRIMASRRKELPGGDCLGGFSAAQLMHRNLWLEFGGYNERLDRAWGWSDNDLMLRVTQKYNWMDVGYYGVIAFHIEHFASTGTRHSRDPNSINRMMLTYDRHPNDASWGLGDMELREQGVTGRPVTYGAPEWEPMSGEVRSMRIVDELMLGDEVGGFFARVAYPVARGTGRDDVNDEAIAAGSAILLREHPRNAVYIGRLWECFHKMIIDGNSGIDLFMVQPWTEGDLAVAPGDPGLLSAWMANSFYRGHARLMCAPALDALEALAASDPFARELEFVLIERPSLGAEFPKVMATVLERLAPGGALLLVDPQRRAPMDPAALKVFVGRILLSASEETRAFRQSEREEELGGRFDVFAMPTGAVHVIRKRPLAAVSAMSVAAE